MWKATVLLALLVLCPGGDGLFRFIYNNARASLPYKGNAGQPLFLTPYIEAGKVKQGRRLSAVASFPGQHQVESYAGFLTVNSTYNSNLFFWFFPALVDSETAPVVLWLQGGPGSSSMFGLFVEHGPYIVTKNLTLHARDFPWTSTLSMLYIDNPVGTGFSFTDDSQGYAVTEDDVARDLFSALVQFFQLFPEYQENDFYATGESYAGKYVPAIAHYIHMLNPILSVKINLKGIAIGDAYFDPESIIGGYASFLYQIGLLDERQRKYFQKLSETCVKYIKEEKWFQAFEVMDKLLDGDLTTDPSYFQNVTGCSNYYNILQCTVLIYNGQLDIIVAAPLTERSLMAMNWKGSREYKKAERKVWKIFKSDKEVAGYVRQVGNFHQVIVRGGGHILPYDQPLRSFDMINRFIFDKGWDPY
ncbi:probable serine carboxypeptidase CPVL isoform X2 [Myotis daubentonii]|uniref:probable serine carboxypeptidase CPVL isoform X2 n=1 Tax=Myotis daubentonii TaxID=98922 RepID=UPI002872C8E6|nr:probable serine carboxypeptidase CPVL isoform X2 [Myotis daubentonii]